MPKSRSFVILPCAGVGRRMGGSVPKFLLDLGGISVLGLTLQNIDECPEIEDVTLILHPEFLGEFQQTILPSLPRIKKVRRLVTGGSERQHSIFHGLQALRGTPGEFNTVSLVSNAPAPTEDEIVLVHDAVRCFASPAIFSRVIAAARDQGAAMAAIPAQDTVKKVAELRVERTVDRSQLWMAQTPQAARMSLLWNAYQRALSSNLLGTDDASLLEASNQTVAVVRGSPLNIKVTTPEDLLLARALWQSNAWKEIEREGGIRL